MSPRQTLELKSEQQILSCSYTNKWNKIALSTDRVHPEKATAAVNSVYQLIGQPQPNILFFDSPIDFIESQANIGSTLTEKNLEIGKLINKFLYKRFMIISQQVGWGLRYQISQQIFNPLKVKLLFIKDAVINYLINNCFTRVNANYIKNNIWLEYLAKIDFFISVFNYQDSNEDWKIFLSLLSECGWIFPLEDTCIVCDRPNLISFDNQNRLHAEGKPAIQYSNKYNIYAYHGVSLPEKYGKFHPHQWQTQWLLTEKNAELRRVLIQGIGYGRLCQELQAVELDTWQEYTLLQISHHVDVETIYLLKMICPSTDYIHVLRVPPNMRSAREAIRWINWGVDAEDFRIQT